MALPFSVKLQAKPRRRSATGQAKHDRTMASIRARQLARSSAPRRGKAKRRLGPLRPLAQPDAIRRQYRSALVAIMDVAHRATWKVLEQAKGDLEAQAAAHRMDGARLDAAAATLISRAAKAFIDALPNSDLARAARRFGELTSTFHREQIVEQFKRAIGVDLFAGNVEPWLPGAIDDFVTENVKLIRSLSSSHFDDLRNHLTEAIADGRRWEAIAEELQERMDISDRHAELIARDQVGKFYGALNEERQTELGVERYTWRTVRDNRVRDEHENREGHVFSWEDPPEDGHPGEAINCRCSAEPDLAALLESIG